MTWHYLFWIIKLINLNWDEMKLVVKKICILDLMFQLTCSKKQRIRQVLNYFFGLTFVGCQKPIDAIVIIRKKTRSECFPKELKELRLNPMIGLEIYTTSNSSSSCKSWCLEAQPLCHHWVHSIAPNQHLPFTKLIFQ